MKWKYLLPMFLMVGRQVAQSLRDKDANSTGTDDEAARAIDDSISHVEKFLQSKEAQQ